MNARSKMHIILLPPTWWQVLLELHHRRSHLQVQPWELNRHERKRKYPLVWTLTSQACIEDSITPNSFERGDHSHSGELLICKMGSSHSRGTRFMLTVALLLVYGAVISRAPYVSSMCEAQRETCSPVIQPAGWNYSAKLLQIDTFMSLPRGISE